MHLWLRELFGVKITGHCSEKKPICAFYWGYISKCIRILPILVVLHSDSGWRVARQNTMQSIQVTFSIQMDKFPWTSRPSWEFDIRCSLIIQRRCVLLLVVAITAGEECLPRADSRHIVSSAIFGSRHNDKWRNVNAKIYPLLRWGWLHKRA